MKIEKATIEISNDAAETTLEYFNMKVIDLAHELIRLAQQKLEIKVTDERRQRFLDEAKKAWVSMRANDYDNFVKMFVDLSVEKFFAVERCNHAYNEAVMAFAPMKKKVFCFDYISTLLPDGKGLMSTHRIEAWDEEHATLLFEKMHPGKSFDPPY